MPESRTKKVSKRRVASTSTGIHGLRGMADVLPKDADWWKYIWQTGFFVSELHDFHFIETPVLETADLFERSRGEATDAAEKYVYIVKNKGGERLGLRAEGKTPIMRSYIEHHLGYFASPLKIFYTGPMFRSVRANGVKEQQFHQWGFMVVGDSDPIYDVEMMMVALDFLNALKVKQLSLKINSIGCRVCRGNYREKLRTFYEEKTADLCEECRKKLGENPVRLLHCTAEKCREIRNNAPIVLDFLCQNCNNHLKTVLEIVEDNNISYEPDPFLVQDFDSCSRTVFEVRSPGSDVALAHGGRCDYLSETMGGRMMPTVSLELDLEQLIAALQKMEVSPILKTRPKVFFAAVGEQARKGSVRLISILRHAGIAVSETVGKRSLKAQLKAAEKTRVACALIYGQKEVFERSVMIRDMHSGAQETLPIEKFLDGVKRHLKSA